MELVPGRECGECSVCCVLLNIDTPEFQKMPRTPCVHLGPAGHGCTIHATVYPVCRAYHCAWRYLEELGEDWRPDKSGVLIEFQNDGFPAAYPKRPGLRIILARPRDTIFQPGFAALLVSIITEDIPVVLSIPGPRGHFPVGSFLNEAMRAAVSAKDSARIVAILRDLLREWETYPYQRVEHRHGAKPAGGS